MAITDDCSDVYIHWSPVEGAKQYSLRLSHNGDLIATVEVQDNTVFKISLSDPQFKDKVISVEVDLSHSIKIEFVILNIYCSPSDWLST